MCSSAPLSGTGCADASFYGGDHDGTLWNCDQDNPQDVAACMLRRLISWGECSAEAPVAPQPDPTVEPPVEPPPPASAPDCAAVAADPNAASDADVLACGFAHELGTCFVSGSCPSCACDYYVKQEDKCDSTGMCASAPLSGTGCATAGYYGGVHAGTTWNCDQGDDAAVAACMLRRLLSWNECGLSAPATSCGG